MGRKTYESIGKPLPNRRNIVISRNLNAFYGGVEVVHSLEDAFSTSSNDEEVFIIGGSNIYEQSLHLVEHLYITEIKKAFEGDAFFPEIDKSLWTESARETHTSSDGLEFSFVSLQKKIK